MDDRQFGWIVRTLRHRRGWRQQDLGEAAGVSQDDVSRLEGGRIDAMPLRRLRGIVAALNAELVLSVRWRGGELDRVLDEGHAALVGRIIAILEAAGWATLPEVSYSVFGERGSIDVLAWHAATRTLLVVEVKTELTSVEQTLRKHDQKVRLAPQVAAERFGWRPAPVGRLLVLPDLATPRRHVRRHAAVLDGSYPQRAAPLRAWLARPSGSASGLLFVSLTRGRRGSHGPITQKRIRRHLAPAAGARTGAVLLISGGSPTANTHPVRS